MIIGKVTPDLDATVLLSVQGRGDSVRDISTVVDTGFNGFLTLPPAVVRALRLPRLGTARAVLADGEERLIDLYEGIVVWNGQLRFIEIDVTESVALLGMAMLRGSGLSIQVVDGGTVTIQPTV